VFIARHTRQHKSADASGGGRISVRALSLGLLLTGLLGLVGCGYAGRPSEAGSPANPSSPSSPASPDSPSDSLVSVLQPTPSSVAFGNVVSGVPFTQTIRLSNAGTSVLTIRQVTASGPGFSVSGASNVQLAPDQSVNVTVAFDPAALGPATGSLMVTSTSAPMQIALSGTGVSAPAQHSVVLSWSPSTSSVAGYFIYRGDGLNGTLSKLITSIISTTNFTDSTVVSGQAYNYAVTSVDSNNVESTYSNQTSVTIPGN
jgi:hypothetical protein